MAATKQSVLGTLYSNSKNVRYNFKNIAHDEYAQGMVINKTLEVLLSSFQDKTLSKEEVISIIETLSIDSPSKISKNSSNEEIERFINNLIKHKTINVFQELSKLQNLFNNKELSKEEVINAINLLNSNTNIKQTTTIKEINSIIEELLEEYKNLENVEEFRIIDNKTKITFNDSYEYGISNILDLKEQRNSDLMNSKDEDNNYFIKKFMQGLIGRGSFAEKFQKVLESSNASVSDIEDFLTKLKLKSEKNLNKDKKTTTKSLFKTNNKKNSVDFLNFISKVREKIKDELIIGVPQGLNKQIQIDKVDSGFTFNPDLSSFLKIFRQKQNGGYYYMDTNNYTSSIINPLTTLTALVPLRTEQIDENGQVTRGTHANYRNETLTYKTNEEMEDFSNIWISQYLNGISFTKKEENKIKDMLDTTLEQCNFISDTFEMLDWVTKDSDNDTILRPFVPLLTNISQNILELCLKYGIVKDLVVGQEDMDSFYSLQLSRNSAIITNEALKEIIQTIKDIQVEMKKLEELVKKGKKEDILETIKSLYGRIKNQDDKETFFFCKFLKEIEDKTNNSEKIELPIKIDVSEFEYVLDKSILELDFDSFNLEKELDKLTNNIGKIEETVSNTIKENEIETKLEINWDINDKTDFIVSTDGDMVKYFLEFIKSSLKIPIVVGPRGSGKTRIVNDLGNLLGFSVISETIGDLDSLQRALIEGFRVVSKEGVNPSILEDLFNTGKPSILLLDEMTQAVNSLRPDENLNKIMNVFISVLDPSAKVRVKTPLTNTGYLDINLKTSLLKLIGAGNDLILQEILEKYPQFAERIEQKLTDDVILNIQDRSFNKGVFYGALNKSIMENLKTVNNFSLVNEKIEQDILENLEDIYPLSEYLNKWDKTEELNEKLLKYIKTNNLDTMKEIEELFNEFNEKFEDEDIDIKSPSNLKLLLDIIRVQENSLIREKITNELEVLKELDFDDELEKAAKISNCLVKNKIETCLEFLEYPVSEFNNYDLIIKEKDLKTLEDILELTYEYLTKDEEGLNKLVSKFGILNIEKKEIVKKQLENSLLCYWNKLDFNSLVITKSGFISKSIKELETNNNIELDKNWMRNIQKDFSILNKGLKNIEQKALNFYSAIIQNNNKLISVLKEETPMDFIEIKDKNEINYKFISTQIPNFDFIKDQDYVINLESVEDTITKLGNLYSDIVTKANKEMFQDFTPEDYENRPSAIYRAGLIFLSKLFKGSNLSPNGSNLQNIFEEVLKDMFSSDEIKGHLNNNTAKIVNSSILKIK